MAQSTYQLLSFTTTITLTWPASFTGTPVVLDINDINTTTNNGTIILPDATLVSNGQNMIFNNVSGVPVYILASDGSTALSHLLSGSIIEMYLINNTTSNGTWRIVPFGGGATSITELIAESTDNSITITNGTVTPPTGTIDFQLPTSITNLNLMSTTDLLVIDGTNPLTFKTVEVIGGENIIVSNGDGLSGNPIIDLNGTLTSLSSITVGDMTLSGEVITNNNVDGNIQLNTNGTGAVQINGVSISSTGNLSGVTNLVSPKAYCCFTDTLTGGSNTIVIEDQVNIASVTGSGGTYVITFITPMDSINYGVITTLGSTGGSLPFISNSYYIVRETNSVTVIVTDASGQLVLSVPNGISVILISS